MTGTTVTGNGYVGRFAPSPTGPLHLGSLFAALVGLLDARHNGGRWLIRVEDIDPPREVAGATDAILRSLEAHALTWDGEVRYQRHSTERFTAAIERLSSNGHTFYCDCARKSLLASGHLNAYPGTCRLKNLSQGALRVRVGDAVIEFEDRWQGIQSAQLSATPGDFVIQRRDQLFAYQLAVVVDDYDSGITDVVRGIDLLSSTPRQIHLQNLLEYPQPRYAHFPVLTDKEGRKLSKQTGSTPVNDTAASANLQRCLEIIGLALPQDLVGAPSATIVQWAVEAFEPHTLRSASPEQPVTT
ncbi:MAG: tRNA glutamyl-Q(34) synthetase GluQRS [Pseudomonadota bacterium]